MGGLFLPGICTSAVASPLKVAPRSPTSPWPSHMYTGTDAAEHLAHIGKYCVLVVLWTEASDPAVGLSITEVVSWDPAWLSEAGWHAIVFVGFHPSLRKREFEPFPAKR